jgi:RNA polymerase sigma-70 factor (ECF subfamily)
MGETSGASGDTNRDVVPHPRDLDLASRVVRRDGSALEQFIGRMQCVPRFVASGNSRLGRMLGPEGLEDLVQDVLAVVWRKLPEYRGDAALETWVFQICEFELRNALRRHASRRAASLDEVGEANASPPRLVACAEAADTLQVAMQRLDTTESMILRLKHFEGLTFEEMAARLASSPNTIKTRYYRALEKLRQELRRRGEDGA